MTFLSPSDSTKGILDNETVASSDDDFIPDFKKNKKTDEEDLLELEGNVLLEECKYIN